MKTLKLAVTVMVLASGMMLTTDSAWAGDGQARRTVKKAVDRNKDGAVSAKERSAARKNYLNNRSEVNKNWEKKADANTDGKVDGKELTTYNRTRANTAWEKKADTDKNGMVSKDEAKAAANDYQTNRSTVDKNWEKKADTNGDGKVDTEELAKWSRAHDGYVSPAEAKKARGNYLANNSAVDKEWEKKADADGDGKVDGQELNYWRRHRVNTAWEKKADTNGDGVVSKDELAAAKAKKTAADTTTATGTTETSSTTTAQ